ncbi:MAG: GxxExxY protein [Pirellulaceae bacterium]
MMDINTVTGHIVDAAIKVHTALGPGLLESAYEICLAHELQHRGLRVETQVILPIHYEGLDLDAGYRIDLLVEDTVIVELKAVEKMLPLYDAQILSYLRLRRLEVGLLINFNVVKLKDGLKRVVNNYSGPSPSFTASPAVNPTRQNAQKDSC